MKYGSSRVGPILLLAALTFSAAVPFVGRHRKLSSPFLAPLGSIQSFLLTPDGSRAVYLGGPNLDGGSGLFSVPADGSAAAVQLDSSTSASPVRSFELSPDGTRVLYTRDPGDFEIYSVPVDGSAAPTLLGTQSTSPSLRIAPDSTRLAFRSSVSGGHLVTVPLTGGTSSQLEALPLGENVEFFEFSEDSVFVVFTTRVSVSPGVSNLRTYRVAADGSTSASLLGAWMSYGTLSLVAVTPTERVVLQTRTTAGKPQLWSVPLDGSSSAAMLHDPATWQANSTIATRVSANGEWLAFSVPAPPPQWSPLHSVRTDASSAALLIGLKASEGSFEFLGATNTLVFEEVNRLFSVPSDGSSIPMLLTPPLAPNHLRPSFLISPDGARVTYIEVDLGSRTRELYSVPAGGGAALKLNTPVTAPNSGVSHVLIDASSALALFWMDEQGDGTIDLFRAPLDGSTAALEIASDVGNPRDARPRASDEHVLWLTTSTPDLVSVAADGTTPPVRLNLELLKGSRLGDVTTFLFAPDGSALFYLADGEADGAFDLYRVPWQVGGGPSALTDLAPFGKVESFPAPAFTPDSSRLVFLAEDQVGDEDELYSVPVDGSATPTKLSLDQIVRSAPMVSSDSTKVAYLAGLSTYQLYVAPIDASSPPVQLNDPLASNRSVTHAVVSHDHLRALYRVDEGTDEVYELYSVPLDASASPVKLSGTMPSSGDVIDPRAAAGRAVYQSDQAVDGKFELYSAPDDGSAAPVKLNHTLTASGTIELWMVSPDGVRIVYLARTSSNAKRNLYVVPSDGSAPPLVVSQHVAGDVNTPKISADSSQVVFRSAAGLWGSPIDASLPAVLLNPPLVPGGSIGGFEISPDAALVAYVATQEEASTSELYCVAIDASTPAVKRSGPLVAGGDVDPWIRFAPDSRHVVYSADAVVDERHDLFWAPVRGGSGPLLVNPRLAPGRGIGSFDVSPDSEEVLYTGDLDEDEVVELYASRVVKGPLRSGPP